ncbi:MAG TPA: hypothetical protein VG077_15790 [Verrucomicrobiae bacterium]|nr:hypothetical protein [Verrucomicrobiae bacterium]
MKRLILAVAFAAFAAGCSKQETLTGPAYAIWISAQSSSNLFGSRVVLGAGTAMNPYFGDVDAIFRTKLTTNQVIHAFPGVYYTRGNLGGVNAGVYLQAGDRLVGSGMDITTFLRCTNAPGYASGSGNIEGIISSVGSNVIVENLTVDCQGQAYQTNKINGIQLEGDFDQVKNCKVLNWCGHFYSPGSGDESWAIYLVGYPVQPWVDKGKLIQNCIAASPQGNYDDAFNSDGQFLMEGNKAYFPILTNGSYFYGAGLPVAGGCGAIIKDNYIEGGQYGAYGDTWGETNLIFENNILKNNSVGFLICGPTPVSADNIKVVNNLIEGLTNYFSSERMMIGLMNLSTNDAPWRRIAISGNTLRFADGVAPTRIEPNQAAFWLGVATNAAASSNFYGVLISGNIVDNELTNILQGLNYHIANNVDQNGDWSASNGLTNNQAALPAPRQGRPGVPAE